jgi:enoyl-CoA hydratase/carnithine racemase
MNKLETTREGFDSTVTDNTAVVRFTADAIKILTTLESSAAFQELLEAIDNSLGTIGYVQINDSEWDSRGAVEELARSIAEDDAFYVKNGRSLGKRRDIVKARFRNTLGSYLLALIDFSKPLVAGFQGEISAEYLGLTLVFDARIATADTTISFDNVHTGMPSSPGITDLMPRYIGIGKTLALANQGTTICASDALGLGLINQIVDDTEDLTSTCLDYTRTLTSQRSDIVHFNRRHMLPPRDHFKAALGRYYEAMSAALIE